MELKLFKYRFPLTCNFVSASHSYAKREGVLLVLNNDKIEAYGEAAPLHGFSKETLEDILKYINQHKDDLRFQIEKKINEGDYLSNHSASSMPDSLVFAIDTLLTDFRAREQQTSSQKILFEKPKSRIEVNATLTLADQDKTLRKAEQLWKKGFRTFKLKIGADFIREKQSIEMLRKQYPSLKLRVDANKSWSYDEAVSNLNQLAPFELEYCEEPIAQSGSQVLSKLRKASPIPIALDESLYQVRQLSHWIERKCADILIIKPMILGGIHKHLEICQEAIELGYSIIFTTALESAVGRGMTAALASGLGSDNHAHGLATGDYFKTDVWEDKKYLKKGYYDLSVESELDHNINFNAPNATIEQIEL